MQQRQLVLLAQNTDDNFKIPCQEPELNLPSAVGIGVRVGGGERCRRTQTRRTTVMKLAAEAK